VRPFYPTASSVRSLKRSPEFAVRLVISRNTIRRTVVPSGTYCAAGQAPPYRNFKLCLLCNCWNDLRSQNRH
jgi:hypothetical protein